MPKSEVLSWILFVVFIWSGAGEGQLLPPLTTYTCPIGSLQVQPLSALLPLATIDYESLMVSGFSSGAKMATQFHIAHSAEVHGCGMFSALPYGTFYNSTLGGYVPEFGQFGLLNYLLAQFGRPAQLLGIGLKSVDQLKYQAEQFASQGKIDPTSNLAGDKVYNFHGTNDPLTAVAYGVNVSALYEAFGADVLSNLTSPATHTVPTDNFPLAGVQDCPIFNPVSDGINNCGDEGVFDMFQHLLGSSFVRPVSSTIPYTGTFSAFNQVPFTRNNNAAADFMDTKGHLYVPLNCQTVGNTCKIHVALHGCWQSIYSNVYCNFFALKTGYLQVADANDMVIVFPAAAPFVIVNGLFLNTNAACWDYFKGTNENFCLKTGIQITAIRKIVRAVAGQP